MKQALWPRVPASTPLELDELLRISGFSEQFDHPNLSAAPLEGVGHLVGDLRTHATLSTMGKFLALNELTRVLVNYLLIQVAAPALEERTLAKPPLVIAGMPRTGTTLLQSLLAEHASFRAVRHWEAMRPSSRAESVEQPGIVDDVRSWCSERLSILSAAVPEFASIHPIVTDGPEECNVLMQHGGASLQFPIMFWAPTYTDWLLGTDLLPHYELLRAQLSLLLGPGVQRQLVLKSPAHVLSYGALGKVFPGAKVVQIWREPTVVFPSWCSLVSAARSVFAPPQHQTLLGSEWSHFWSIALGRAVDALGADHAGVEVFTVAYADLIREPVRVVEAICELVGVMPPRGELARLRIWLSQQPRRAPHDYRAITFGLDEQRIEQTFGAPFRELHATGAPLL